MNRRSLLTSVLSMLAARWLPLPAFTTRAEAQATSSNWRHGMSPFGELKYPASFKHFEYVNPGAPKGGSACQIGLGGFDNFNLVINGVKGSAAQGIDLVYQTLFVPALDEVSSEYGLLAEAVSFPDDISSATFRLRAEAKWHDGKPITPDDVIFSFNAFKQFNPQLGASFRQVVKAEKSGDRDVTFKFDAPGNKKLPLVLGQLAILSKTWWESPDGDGKKRDVGSTTLDPPLGSGPYRIKEFAAGRSIVYERVKDYWGKNVNVNIGRDNFDELKFEYFRDATVAIEAFKTNTVDWRAENSAKNWVTAYDFAAVKEKRVVLEEFPISNFGIMQAFTFNLRREKFQDARVRRAFNYAFDFETLNKQLFFGQYNRIASFFEGTELAASGLPAGRELELLEAVRDKVPAEVFTKVYSNPQGGNPTAIRNNQRDAVRLFDEAGYEIREQQLVNKKTGEPFTIELLSNAPAFERVFLFYKPSLERLGITVSVRSVDEAQYVNRLRTWDFDIMTYLWAESLQPGNEQRGYWGSQSADESGSENVIGIKNPAVDALIEQIVFAKHQADLFAACRALDRVLLWNHYVVPQWSYSKMRSARWDRFSHHNPLPKYGQSAFPTLWWMDPDKVAKVGSRQ